MQTRNALTLLVGVAVLTFVPASTSHAAKHSQKFTTTFSGTIVDIPLDLDADSCTTSGGVTVCTDFSAYLTDSGKATGTIGGFTAQAVEEYDPVSGSGCTILGSPVPIAGCTLTGSSETGCEFKSVGGAIILRANATGDLLFETESTTVCEDFSSGPPFNSTAAAKGGRPSHTECCAYSVCVSGAATAMWSKGFRRPFDGNVTLTEHFPGHKGIFDRYKGDGVTCGFALS